MTDNIILEAIQKFLKENVATKIKLQAPADDNIKKYQLMHPNVFIGWIPPPNQLNDIPQQLMDGSKKALPAMIVGFDDGDDDGSEAGLNIRISFGVYNPGYYVNKDIFPNMKGYQDLINLIFLARQELSSSPVIEGGKTEVSKPIKWGMYADSPIPYWWGWLTFRATVATLNPLLQKYCLE